MIETSVMKELKTYLCRVGAISRSYFSGAVSSTEKFRKICWKVAAIESYGAKVAESFSEYLFQIPPANGCFCLI